VETAAPPQAELFEITAAPIAKRTSIGWSQHVAHWTASRLDLQQACNPDTGPLPARDQAFARSRLLGKKGDGTAELAANRKPLQESGDQDRDRCREPDRRITRLHHRHRRADNHQQDRQGEPGLAAGAIGMGADRDCPMGPPEMRR
jgi:hypothetical protein